MEVVDRREEAKLAQRASTGDPKAIRKLVEYITPTVNRSVQRYLGSMARVSRIQDWVQNRDELYQEVMMELFSKALGGFNPEKGGLHRYVGSVANRVCYTKVHRAQLDLIDEPVNPEVTKKDSVNIDNQAEARMLLGQLFTRLTQKMSPEELRLFKLLVIEERSHEEVSQLTGISVPILHVRKSRLRSRVKELLKKIAK